MDDGIRNYPRSTVAYGDDCTVEFVRRADNNKALVEVWRITMSGQQFDLHMMLMRHKFEKNDMSPWVFGSITALSTKKQIWSFRDDVRVVNRGFVGDVFTVVAADGCTRVSYQMFGSERYRILLSELLLVDHPEVIHPTGVTISTHAVTIDQVDDERVARWTISAEPVDRSDEMATFVNQVLRWL